MSLDENSVKNQLTDLFGKTDNLKERMSAVEVLIKQNQDLIKAVNGSSKKMEAWVEHANTVLYGNDKLGIDGLVSRNKCQEKKLSKHELIIVKVGITLTVLVVLLKHLGILDKIL